MTDTPSDIGELKDVLRADWARSANRTPSQRLVLLVFRLGQYVHSRRRRGPLYYAWRIADLVYLKGVLGAELAPTAKIGPGLALPHAGRGVAVGDGVVIGQNSMIFHRVTIGPDRGSGAPHLGDDIYAGVGACVLGPVSIGSRVRIGANAVVVGDVPEGAVVFGVPARVMAPSD